VEVFDISPQQDELQQEDPEQQELLELLLTFFAILP
jgi:hypothetical protein